jgi:signal peptidase I
MNHAQLQSFFRQCFELLLVIFFVCLVRTFIFGLYQVPTGSMETTMLVGERFFADKLTYFFRAPRQGEIIAFMQPTYHFSTNPIKRFVERFICGPENWTKRVIGCPSDHVQGKIEDGKAVIYLNGKKLDEPYLNKYPLITVRTHGAHYVKKSFDASKPYDKQPFYHIEPDSLYADLFGTPFLVYPHQVRHFNKAAYPGVHWGNGADEFDVHLGPNEYWVMGDNRRGSHDSRYFGPIKQEDVFARISWLLFSIDTDESWVIVDLIKHPLAFWKKIRFYRTLRPLS